MDIYIEVHPQVARQIESPHNVARQTYTSKLQNFEAISPLRWQEILHIVEPLKSTLVAKETDRGEENAT